MSFINKEEDLAAWQAAYGDELKTDGNGNYWHNVVDGAKTWIKKGCGHLDYIHSQAADEAAGEPAVDAAMPRACPGGDLPDLAGHNSFATDQLKANTALYDSLKGLTTAGGVCLADCLKTGIDNKGHPNIKPVGLVAGDEESYTLFKDLFDPVIDARHGGYGADATHISDMNTANLSTMDMDPTATQELTAGVYVKTSRVRTGRSVRGFNLPPCNSFAERRSLESKIVTGLMKLGGNLAGNYFPLHGSKSNPNKEDAMANGMSHEKEQDLLTRGNLFQEPDSTLLLSGGMGRHWPDARGIFHNNDQNLFVWLNEEDHMRVVSMQPGKNMNEVAARFMNACNELNTPEIGIDFMKNDHLGWILTCPSNLGTGLRAGCQVSLRCLNALLKDHSNADLKWKKALAHMGLQARGVGGVDVVGTDVFDISNADRLGKSDTTLINFTINGITLLVRCEHHLRTNNSDEASVAKVEGALMFACGLAEGSTSASTSKGADGMGNGFTVLATAADMLDPVPADYTE